MHKPLDGSILLKFLLETRLKSASFHTLDYLLGLRVLKYDLKTTNIVINPLIR